jgi:hypothetical protein
VGPQGGDVGDPGASTINARNVDGGTPGRQCQTSGSTHHQRKKSSMAGPLRGSTGDLEAPTINAKKYRWRAP